MKNTKIIFKKVTTILLIIFLLATIHPIPTFAATQDVLTYGDFQYSIVNDHIIISKYIGKGGQVVVPDKINNKPVTTIGMKSFMSCENITQITLPNSITEIGAYSFSQCYELQNINIPANVSTIGEAAFFACVKLQSISIPNKISKINSYVFSSCYELQQITIPTSVTEIGDFSFSGCYGLKNVTLTNNISIIGIGAFYGCESIGNIYLPNKITKINDYTFYNCIALKEITIPNTVTQIGKGAFKNCQLLNKIVIPNTVTELGPNAFEYCTGLTEVILSDKITEIKDSSFNGCTNLKSAKLSNNTTIIGNNSFKDCTSLSIINIPNTLLVIGSEAFGQCYNLSSFTIPSSVTEIGDNAFMNCNNLSEISLPNKLTELGWGVFKGCTKLNSIFIPKSVLIIGASAFDGCSNLTIHGYKDSIAQSCAEFYCIPFKEIVALQISNFNTSSISPQKVGTAITLSAVGTGNGTLKYRFCVNDGTTPTVLQDFATTSSVIWKPTKAGTYTISVGITDISGLKIYKTFLYTINNELKITSFKPTLVSPQKVGTGITLSATGTGIGTLSYKFSVTDGTTTTVLKDFSTINSAKWIPTKAGTYKLVVALKDSTGKVTYNTISYVIAENINIAVTSLKTDLASTQKIGTAINLSATGTGIGTLSYKFYVTDGTTTTVVKDFSTINSAKWIPTKAGTYKVVVSLKDSTGRVAYRTMSYVIAENINLAITSFKSNVVSPQMKNTAINLSAIGTGLGALSYKFTVTDGTTTTLVKDFSTTNSAIWKPTKAGTYKVVVELKDSTNKIVYKTMTYIIVDTVTISSLKVNLVSPQKVGTSINISANGIGDGTLTYKFSIDSGTGITVLHDYSTINSAIWTPTKAGTYKVVIALKDSTGKVASRTMSYVIS